MNAPKHLILSLPSENDWLVAVVPLPAGFQDKMSERLARLEALHAEDDDLDEMVFSACGDAWSIEHVQGWIDENDGDHALDDRRWLLVDEDPGFDAERRTRLSVLALHLTRHGDYYWSFLPKHWDETYESVSFDTVAHRPESGDDDGTAALRRELAQLEAEFEAAGGRGVETAERIDEIRQTLGE